MFIASGNEQVTFDDRMLYANQQTKEAVAKSRAQLVADIVYPNIDEQKFAPLFSEKGSRPNIPISIYVSALILKRMYGLSDENFLEFLRSGALNLQVALHTTQYKNQPLSASSLRRFRRRVEEYNAEFGCDLIKEEFMSISEKMAVDMGVLQPDPSEGDNEEKTILVRMDSMEIEAHGKAMSRVEIIYTTIVIMLRWLLKKGFGNILTDVFTHYLEEGDKNKTIYHRQKEDKKSGKTDTRLEELIRDLIELKGLMEKNLSQEILSGIPEYNVMQRVLDEQTMMDADGNRVPKDGKEISADSVQNPFDTTMTYRYKRGKHHGFVMNVAEAIDGEGNGIVIHADVEPNTASDSSMAEKYIEQQPDNGTKQVLTADGAYSGEKLDKMAKQKGIEIRNTSLTGSMPYDIDADFEMSEDGEQMIRCPAGKEPEANKYNPNTGMVTATMPENCCATCPHRDECNTRFNKKETESKVVLSSNMVRRAQQSRSFSTDEGKANARMRNGVEGIMSVMRRKYNIDHLPVFGLDRLKSWIWTTLLSYNLVKYQKYKLAQKKAYAA